MIARQAAAHAEEEDEDISGLKEVAKGIAKIMETLLGQSEYIVKLKAT